jgi:DNA-binding NtrC family response regulator
MRKRVLFVDDEQKVLDALQRMLRPMRDKWDMSFVSSGQNALASLGAEPFDVLITDMRMPGMDGVQLLKEVRNGYPEVVRIVLSGQSEGEMFLKSVRLAHQYLSKPCDADALTRLGGFAGVASRKSLQIKPSIQKVFTTRSYLVT